MKARDALLSELPQVSTFAALIDQMRKTDDAVVRKLVGPWWNESSSGSGVLSVELGGRSKIHDLMPLVLRALELQQGVTAVRIQRSGLEARDVELLCAKLPDSVVELDLRQNEIGDAGAALVAALLRRRKAPLASVSLDECGITEAGLAPLCKTLTDVPFCLKHLSIGDNAMGRGGLQVLAKLLEMDTARLESLRLENWDFDNGGGFELLTKALRSNKWLQTLFASKITAPVGDPSAWTDFLLATGFLAQETPMEDQLELNRALDPKTRCANPTCRAAAKRTGKCGGTCGGLVRYCSKACQAFDWPLHRRREGCVNNAVTLAK